MELKAEECLTKNDEAQLLNYLNATKFQAGILANFGAKSNLEWKRMILTRGLPADKDSLSEDVRLFEQ